MQKVDTEKMAAFIAAQRKAKGLTQKALAYADTATKEKARRLPRIAQAVITALCATGIGTCFICDLAISGGLTWSLLVGAAILYFWLVAIPPIRWGRKKGVALSLAVLCLGLLPFLYTVEGVLGLPGAVTPMGARVGAMGAVLLWACYLLFLKLRPLTAGGVSAFVSIPFIWGINATVDFMLVGRYGIDVWDVLTIALLMGIGVSLLAAGRRRSR